MKKLPKVLWACPRQPPDEYATKLHGSLYTLSTRKSDACIKARCPEFSRGCAPVSYAPRAKGKA
ncbi:hypothetical protein LCGC14_1156510 [marine sediment metagenome]|uniref:Uncharacterized protein n=1 Tax=marine sediment metagenome TaxID=412755 RepID=A0A0F9LYV0_9ZZZZ